MNKNKKFISIIWWYHKQIFTFKKEQNYHMMPLEVMMNEWYNCEIYAIDSQVKIEGDPNFVKWVKVIYYKNLINYLYYLWKNKNYIIYSNSLTLKTLLVWIIWKRTVFYPHSFPFWHNKIKTYIIIFFYNFFTKIRINNTWEFELIEKIKKWLAYVCPLVVSSKFLNINLDNRTWWTWIWNLTRIKNPEFLIETCKNLKNKKIDFSINIIWEDRYSKNWKSFSDLVIEKWLEEYIKVLWFLTPLEIKRYLSQSLVYINTSISEWQCLSVYEWALAWNILCLPNILSFPSVFWKNALYHNSPKELAENITNILKNKDKYEEKILKNQKMILKNYSYCKLKECLFNLFIK